jgi:nucleoside phosphorylase
MVFADLEAARQAAFFLLARANYIRTLALGGRPRDLLRDEMGKLRAEHTVKAHDIRNVAVELRLTRSGSLRLGDVTASCGHDLACELVDALNNSNRFSLVVKSLDVDPVPNWPCPDEVRAEIEQEHSRAVAARLAALTDSLPSTPPRPDVVLVTVNEHETRAVHDAFLAATGNEAKPISLGGRSYHDLGRIGATTVYHAISEMGSGGSGGMQQTVEKAISNLEPGAVIAVGIAFGVNEEDQQLGDILVSKLLRLYEQQRVGKKGKITLRGASPDASPRLMSHFRSFQQTKWAGAKVRFGVVLSGEKLIDNVDFRDSLVRIESEAVGGEMEGAGLYVSSHDNKVDWIVIKAICDWADGNKGVEKEERQKQAAKNSAEFMVESLSYASLLHPNGEAHHRLCKGALDTGGLV